MTQRPSPFGDFAPLAQDLLKLAQNLCTNMTKDAPLSSLAAKAASFANGHANAVSRDDFEAALTLMGHIRQQQKAIESRLAVIESRLKLGATASKAKKRKASPAPSAPRQTAKGAAHSRVKVKKEKQKKR